MRSGKKAKRMIRHRKCSSKKLTVNLRTGAQRMQGRRRAPGHFVLRQHTLCGFKKLCKTPAVLSKCRCPVFLANEVSGFGFSHKVKCSVVVVVELWKSQAAFWRDFSKPLREAT